MAHIIPTDSVIARIAEFAMNDKAEKPIEVRCKISEGSKYELVMSQMEALQYWLSMEQERGYEIMLGTGWDDKSFARLIEFIKPEVKEFGQFLRDEYKRIKPMTDKVYENMFFVRLADNINYAPLAVDNPNFDNQWDIKDMGNNVSPGEVRPGSIKARLMHNHPLRQVSALDMYFKHLQEQANFIANAEIGRELKAIFKHKDVQNVLRNYMGRKFTNTFNTVLDNNIRGGTDKILSDKLADRVRFVTSLWIIGGKADNLVKQWTSMLAALAEIGPVEFSKGITDFFKNPIQNINEMRKLPYFKNRWYSGFNRDIKLIQSSSHLSPANIWSLFIKTAMFATKVGDIGGVMPGFYAVYKSNINKMEKSGISNAEEKAFLKAEKYSDRTQQAGATKDLGFDQMRGSWAKLLQIFMTSQRQYSNVTNEAIAEAIAGKKNSYKTALNYMFVYWVLLPCLFQGAADALRKLFDDEYAVNWENYLVASLSAPVSGYYIIGPLMYTAAQQFIAGKNYSPEIMPGINQILDDTIKAGKYLSAGESEKAVNKLFRSNGFSKTYKLIEGGYSNKK